MPTAYKRPSDTNARSSCCDVDPAAANVAVTYIAKRLFLDEKYALYNSTVCAHLNSSFDIQFVSSLNAYCGLLTPEESKPNLIK